MSTTQKDPARVQNGKLGAAKRWGPKRIVYLAELDADTARLIRALVANAETEPMTTAKAADDAA